MWCLWRAQIRRALRPAPRRGAAAGIDVASSPLVRGAPAHGDAGKSLPDNTLSDKCRDVGGGDGGGRDLDDVGADQVDAGGDGAAGPEQLTRGQAARLRRPGARGERGVEDVDVDGEQHRALADDGDSLFDDRAD